MLTRPLHHIRDNVIAYLALFVALGGTSYAALSVPNHSITPVKLDPRYIGGYVRAWVSVDANGKVRAKSGNPRLYLIHPDHYTVFWRTKPSSGCTAVANVDGRGVGTGPLPGYALTQTLANAPAQETTVVTTFNAGGESTGLPFDAVLVC